MVAQFTQPQQLAPPQAPSPSLSPAQWAQLAQLAQTQQQQQSASPQQAAPHSTSAYTSSGTMSAIDPALLQAQWLQLQQGQLAQSAIIPQYQPQYQHQQYAPPQSAGEFISADTIAAITDFIEKAGVASNAAAQYIAYLQNELATVDRGYLDLVQFSGQQDALIEQFLFDPVFLLDYIRDVWSGRISDSMMELFAKTYLAIAETSPRGANPNRNPEFTGNPNPQFSAAVVPSQPATIPQMSLPPLPSSNGSATPYITLDQYLAAQQQGQVAQARAAALQNPTGLYGALLQRINLLGDY